MGEFKKIKDPEEKSSRSLKKKKRKVPTRAYSSTNNSASPNKDLQLEEMARKITITGSQMPIKVGPKPVKKILRRQTTMVSSFSFKKGLFKSGLAGISTPQNTKKTKNTSNSGVGGLANIQESARSLGRTPEKRSPEKRSSMSSHLTSSIQDRTRSFLSKFQSGKSQR